MYLHGMSDVWDLKVSTYWVVDWDWMTWSSTWNYSIQMVKRFPHNRWIPPPPPPPPLPGSYRCISNSMFCAVLGDIKMLDQVIIELDLAKIHTHYIYIGEPFQKQALLSLYFIPWIILFLIYWSIKLSRLHVITVKMISTDWLVA